MIKPLGVLHVALFAFSVVAEAGRSCPGNCDEPLGIEDGRITDAQMNASRAYNDDAATYGAHRGRLELTSQAPGYRANPVSLQSGSKPWISIDLGREMLITGVATQGYGDRLAQEWVKSYIVKYSYDGHPANVIKNTKGDADMVFVGNNDTSSIQRHVFPVAVIATDVTLVPQEWNNNVGLRMELFGCEPGYHVVVWLLVENKRFTLDLADSTTRRYETMRNTVMNEVNGILNGSPGFLSAELQRFGPQSLTLSDNTTYLMAVIELFCIKPEANSLTDKLQSAIRDTPTMFSSQYMDIMDPFNCTCPPASVKVKLSKTLELAREDPVTFKIILEAEVDHTNCSSVPNVESYWDITRANVKQEVFQHFLATGRSTTKPIYSLTRKFLYDSFYYTSYILRLPPDNRVIGYDYGFFFLLTPPPVVKINGVAVAIKGNGNVTLNASESYDPVPDRGAVELSFLWFCRRMDENLVMNKSYPLVDIPNGNPNIFGGCFGHGPGRLSSVSRVYVVDVDRMEAGQSYSFELVVASTRKSSRAAHVLMVEMKTPDFFSIRCTYNCGPEVITTKRMIVESNCTGLQCQNITSYDWSLYKMDPSNSSDIWARIPDLSNRILTKLNNPSLVLTGKLNANEHSLENNASYKIKGTIHMDDGVVKEDEIVFKTVMSPSVPVSKERCSVEPDEGFVVETQFLINCSGWQSGNESLTYDYGYMSPTGLVAIKSTSSNSSLRTILPQGELSHDYNVTIRVGIFHPNGASATDVLIVKVKPQSLEPGVSNSSDKIQELVGVGKVGEAAHLASCLLSASSSDELKGAVLGEMAAATVTDLSEVSQLSVVVTMATENRPNISLGSLEDAARILTTSTGFVRKHGRDRDEVQGVGRYLLRALSVVLNASSDRAAETYKHSVELEANRESKEDETFRSKLRERRDVDEGLLRAKDLAENTLSLVDELGSALLSTKMAGEKPSTFTSDFITMTIDRQTPSKMGGTTLRETDEEGGVTLPPAETLFGRSVMEMSSVDAQVLTLRGNPYSWTNLSETIQSSVVTVDLKTDNGTLLNISSLGDPVELFIPDREPSKTLHNESSGHLFVKPFNASNAIRYHKIKIENDFESAFVEIRPQNNTIFEVFVGRGVRPTADNYTLSARVPDFSSCRNHQAGVGYFNCKSDPYLLTFSSNVTGGTGVHFIGIRRTEIDMTKRVRVSRSCKDGSGRQKRSCIGVKDPPTTPPPTPELIVPEYDKNNDINYTISVVIKSCLYWSVEKEVWTGEGCKVGPKAVIGQLQCLCTHLSAFGGNIFVAPNPIDFTKVWWEFGRLQESGNIFVIITVCLIFGVYFVGLIFARRADKKDTNKVVANLYLNDSTTDEYSYGISIQTGMWKGCGTSASVGIILNGEHGSSGPILLTDPLARRKFFARGSVNNFTLNVPASLGKLSDIRIWHDNTGSSPAWYLHQVVVTDKQAAEKWYFFGNRWLALDNRSGVITLDIEAAVGQELTAFEPLFVSRAARSFGEAHIWISVFTKPPHNPFTRCQRLSCCLSFLFTAMVTNAMFYQFGRTATDTFKFGPLVMSWTQIKVGIQSSVIAIPANLLVVLIFKNTKQILSKDIYHPKDDDMELKASAFLPHFCVYIAWFLCLLFTLTGASFTVFYSMMWGAHVSNQWLTSILVSLAQDVLISQPIKVLALAALLSLLIKKPPEQETVIGATFFKSEEGERGVPHPQGEEELAEEKDRSSKLWNMTAAVRETVSFVIFAVLVMVICYGGQDNSRYPTTKSLNDIFGGFEKVVDTSSLWNWIDTVLVPGLYDVEWYNGQPFEYKEGFISSRNAFMMGMPRLRQIRIKKDKKCSDLDHVSTSLSAMFPRCLPTYSAAEEYKTALNLPQWIPLTNRTRLTNIDDVCPKPWRYRSDQQTQTRAHQGVKETYEGGGYVADLGYNKQSAEEVVRNLQAQDWIDDLTAAVFIEFTVFSPSTSLFSVVRSVYERLPIGAAVTTVDVKTFALYPSSDVNFQSFYEVCQLLFLVLIIACLIAEIVKFFRQKKYLRQLWNWVELLLLVVSSVAVVMSFLKAKYTSAFVKEVQKNPYKTTSSDYILRWSEHETFWFSMTIFILTLKLLRLIRFNHHICQMQGTLKRSARQILSFSLVFAIAIIAFAQFAVICFGPKIFIFSSFFHSLRVVLQMSVGKQINYFGVYVQYPYMGPLYLFFYLNIITFVLINIFVAILVDEYAEIRLKQGDEFNDAELGAFMYREFVGRVKRLPGQIITGIQELVLNIKRRYTVKNAKYGGGEGRYVRRSIANSEDVIFLELFEPANMELSPASPSLFPLQFTKRVDNGREVQSPENTEHDHLVEIKADITEIAAELRFLSGSAST